MPDPRIDLKNPWIAGVLAFLIPGAGHLYQRRLFKAVVYFVCILGLYLSGMAMADWKAVYVHRPGNQPPRGRHHMLQFIAQAGVGLPAVCALVQNKRFYSPDNKVTRELTEPITASFIGEFEPEEHGLPDVDVQGTVELVPVEGRFGMSVGGRFYGTTEDGEEVEFELGELEDLAEPVNADRRREIDVAVVQSDGDSVQKIGELEGSIPRPFKNWFVVPVESQQESDLHRKLGKFHELAMVFTWVAGLLNILVVWDALEGPAYGYGDELAEAPPDGKEKSTDAGPSTKSDLAPAEATA